MDIQWYPGHMTKSKRMMAENIKLVDVVVELLDARIPLSSKNPDIDTLAAGKQRVVVLNKADLADAAATVKWLNYYTKQGFKAISADSIKGDGIKNIADASKSLMSSKIERLKDKGRIFVPVRAMIVGIPNVGKSTLINKYVGKALTKTGDLPGVTRGKQWIRIKKDFELLDTPGILWPKFEDKNIGMHLAITGAINDDILDRIEIACGLIDLLTKVKPGSLNTRYKTECESLSSYDALHKIGEARGFKQRGNEIDMGRAAAILLDEFRAGKLGRITLEYPAAGR